VSGVWIALISWALSLLFAWQAYRAVKTSHMSVGALPAFNFTRKQRPFFFWSFTTIFVLFSLLMLFNGFGAMFGLPPPVEWAIWFH